MARKTVVKNGELPAAIAERMGLPKPASAPSNEIVGVTVKPLRSRIALLNIIGESPLMMLRFHQKVLHKMMEAQRAGTQSRSRKVREPRNFEDDCKNACYVSPDGWYGIPAVSFRHALIDTCRLVGFKMTIAKMTLFVEGDGFDKFDGQPLVRIISSAEPEMTVMPVRNATGVMDLRARPMWREWSCHLAIRFDEDHFSYGDVYNLLYRAGQQNGIGEGRVNSKNSVGMGYGRFRVEPAEETLETGAGIQG